MPPIDVIDQQFNGLTNQIAGLELDASQRNLVRANVNFGEARGTIRFELALGAEVPENVRLQEFTPVIVETIPKLESYRYIVVGDNVLIINPKEREIALVIRNPN